MRRILVFNTIVSLLLFLSLLSLTPSFPFVRQPTVHFAEEPIYRGGNEDGEDEEGGDRVPCSDLEEQRPQFPSEKQRLIRKDTPHYKKHFKITKLPKPEAVAALLQGFSPDAHLAQHPTSHHPDPEEEEEEEYMVTPQRHNRIEEPEQDDRSLLHVNSSLQPVKVNWARGGGGVRGWWVGNTITIQAT